MTVSMSGLGVTLQLLLDDCPSNDRISTKPKVTGSNPVGRVAVWGDIPRWQAESGREQLVRLKDAIGLCSRLSPSADQNQAPFSPAAVQSPA